MSETEGKSPALEELEAYYSMLPAAFKEKFLLGKTGIPGDFVNNYAALHVQIATIREDAAHGLGVQLRDVADLHEYIRSMISYREYLQRRMGNILVKFPEVKINAQELIEKMMDIPFVAEMEANIVEIQQMHFEAGSPDFFDKLSRLQGLVDFGIAIIRDTVTIDQLKAKFPGRVF